MQKSTSKHNLSLSYGEGKPSTFSIESKALQDIEIENLFDIGCCRGQVLSELIAKYNPKNAYGFEPNSYNFSIASRLGKNIFNVAMSNYDGEAKLFVADKRGEHSLFTSDKNIVTEETVKVTRFDTWAKWNGITNFDFVKIDTQGNDLNVIKGMGDLLSQVKILKVEVFFNRSEYNDVPLFSDIMDYLINHGMMFYHFSTVPCQPSGVLDWCDAIFLNNNLFKELVK